VLILSKVKRQHYVPRLYLKQWANSSKQVIVLDKSNNKQYPNNIQNVASANYFYDGGTLPDEEKEKIREIAKEEGILEEIEPYLANNQMIEYMVGKIEATVAPILDSVISRLNGLKLFPQEYLIGNSAIKNNEYYDIAYFISLQAVRTKEHRKMIDEIHEGMIKKLAQLESKQDGFESDIEEKTHKEIIQKGKFNVEIDDEYSKYMHVTQMFSQAETIVDILLSHKWLIQRRTTDLQFITSDHPVIKHDNIQHPFYGAGYASKGIEIHFPLSPDYEILIYERSHLASVSPFLSNPNLHIIDSIEENVIYSNDLQVYHSDRQLFSTNSENLKLAKKRMKESPKIYKKKRITFN